MVRSYIKAAPNLNKDPKLFSEQIVAPGFSHTAGQCCSKLNLAHTKVNRSGAHFPVLLCPMDESFNHVALFRAGSLCDEVQRESKSNQMKTTPRDCLCFKMT